MATPVAPAHVRQRPPRHEHEVLRPEVRPHAAGLRSAGRAERAVQDVVEMFAAQDDGIYDADWARATTAPTDLRTWCREVLLPAVAG
ncbi:hypothetical protein Acsp07_41330 [Actinomycetospora sp. NBRC 106378]|nr:hypothetical protein Acsp07_41330 [Actinomycetospora sp. NBRC 106378]